MTGGVGEIEVLEIVFETRRFPPIKINRREKFPERNVCSHSQPNAEQRKEFRERVSN